MKHGIGIASVLLAVQMGGTSAHAAGFALVEQGGSAMGNAFAGGAASAEDASTIFFNPAGMTYLPDNQLVMAAHAARPSINFNTRTARSGAGTVMTGDNGGDGGGWSLLPNFYFEKSVSDSIRLGIGVNAPFGLNTEYDSNWVGRYQALETNLKAININPAIAFRASDALSLGFGISAMRAEATLTNAVDFGTICAGLSGCGIGATPQGNDGGASLHGDSWAFGWNAGAIFQIDRNTRLGLAYRSQMHQNLNGTVTFSNVPAALKNTFSNGAISAKITMPDSLSASVFHHLNDRWDLMGDLTWTDWSIFQNLTAIRSSGGATVVNTPEHWHNTTRTSVGASYRYSDALKARIGLAYDESPTPSAYRNPRAPGSDNYWLSLGASYSITPVSSIDFGYAHLFIKGASLNQSTAGTPSGTLVGSYSNDANILSLQFAHTF
ncbi:47 kDa outer membrane protein precursor [mine drainage metagenome]|uniref:47 kDa outer membrane protein n=1 Tax=mine drainage metagenome TaxID=410659 RepID=A0A1J5QZ31_9ZZZZ